MPVLNTSLASQLHDAFATLTSPVTLAVFTDSSAGATTRDTCAVTSNLVEELAEAAGAFLSVDAHDLATEPGVGAVYGVDKVPAIVVLGGMGKRDVGIRFFGVPSGYEFGTLVEAIRMVSRDAPGLAQPTLDTLSRLRTPIHIQVYVTPTCPYCPRAAVLAQKLALASDHVTADVVDAAEFPELADRYDVRGVPRTVINEALHIEGAVPEAALMAELRAVMEA